MSEDTETVAYSYGCPAWYDLPPEFVAGPHSPEPGCEGPYGPPGQLLLANRLWNALVSVHLGHETEKARIWRTDPTVSAAQDDLDAAHATVSAVYARMREARMRDRSTVPREDDSAALAEAKRAAKTARDARDSARETAREKLRGQFAEALRARAAAVKALYPDFAGAGLGWATFNDITRRRFGKAAEAVEKARTQGESAELRFRRFDGTGTLTVQVMGGTGIPPRTVPALNAGNHPRSGVMRLEPWADPSAGRPKGKARHGTLSLTFGRSRERGPLTLEIPVVLDRHMPANAEIAEVKVTRFRQGSHHRVKVSVVASQPRTLHAPENGASIAVRLSWKSAGDGWVTVARIGSPAPLPPLPPGLETIVRVSADGKSAEVLYHAAWRKLLERDAGIRSIRDQNTDILRDKVAAALRDDEALAGTLGVTAADVARWKSPGRSAALARRWPAGHALAGVLEEWRARDRHLLDFEQHESAQVTGARQDAYRRVAKWLCGGASGLVIDGRELDDLKRAPGDDREDPEQARKGRAQMHRAAPGELRAAIGAAAGRRSIPVTVVKPAKTAKTKEA